MADDQLTPFCLHCGNQSPLEFIDARTSTGMSRVISDSEWGDEVKDPVTYLTAVCSSCNAILIYCSFNQSINSLDELDIVDLEEAALVYPTVERIHHSVPETISTLYWDAYRIKKTAPDLFVMQMRRALEAVCKDRGATGKDLQKKLADLLSKGELPKILSDVRHEIRDLGNKTAHEPDERIKMWQANTIDDYFRAVIEHVYVLPFKLKEFRDSLSRMRSRDTKEQTGSIH